MMKINDLFWKLIEKLISIEYENRMLLSIMSVITGCADDRDWPMDWRCRHKGCLELGTIVSLTDAGEKKLYSVYVHYLLLLLLLNCVCCVML